MSTSGASTRLLWASWSSASKSETARSPRTRKRGAGLAAELDGEPVERRHLDRVGQARLGVDRGADDGDPLVGRQERGLARVREDRDDHPVERARRAAQHVEVAVRERVERPGVDRDPHVSPASCSGSAVRR